MDMSSSTSWSRRNAGPRNEEDGKSPSDPSPYYLHDLKSPEDHSTPGPWHSNHLVGINDQKSSSIDTFVPRHPSRSTGSRSVDFEAGNLPIPVTKLRNSSRHSPWRRLSAALTKFSQSEPFWLGLYFLFNLGLTLYNKIVLVTFPFPYTLTAIHAFCGSIGCYMLQEYGFYVPARLTARQNATLLGFSVLYAINIAVSNLSLQLVTIPFHQVVRAASPLFTIALGYFLIGTTVSPIKILSLLPVVGGVGFTTYGDYYFTYWGLILTLFGTFLASLKTIVTNILQSGNAKQGATGKDKISAARLATHSSLKLHPLDLLGRMSPLAFIQCVIYGWASGELDGVRKFGATHMDVKKLSALCVNGMIAFGLNVVSFTANRKSGPLAISVAANVKQVLTVILAVSIFNLIITPTNMIGIVLTLGGGGWYAAVEYKEKMRKASLATLTSLRK